MSYFLENLKIQLAESINKIIKKEIVKAEDFVYPPNPEMGDLSLPCFDLAKKLNKSPNEVAEGLISRLKDLKEAQSLKALGPYFNIVLNKTFLNEGVVSEVLKKGKKYGQKEVNKKKKIMVEYSNVNTHKEYHVGHLRNLCYGDAVKRILIANGHSVAPVSYINDFGIHVAKTIFYFQFLYNGQIKDDEIIKYLKLHASQEAAENFSAIWDALPPEKKAIIFEKFYSLANKYLEKDKLAGKMIEGVMKAIESRRGEEYQIWQDTRKLSIKGFEMIYKDLKINFKEFFYESDFVDQGRKMVDDLLKKEILSLSQGAIIADLEKYGLGVLVVIRSDGTMLYPVADLSLAKHKIKEFNLDESIYVVDNRQSLYFKQLFKILELAGFGQEMVHLAYDFVKLPSGMMSSRTGNVVTYYDLKGELIKRAEEETTARHVDWDREKIRQTAEKISFGAIKFEMLKVSAQKTINFEIEKALSFDGYTAAYIQYAYARIQSIKKKSKIKNNSPETIRDGKQAEKLKLLDYASLSHDKEHLLILKIAKYPEVLERAGENYDSSEIAKYLFELAQDFNDYYHSVPVLKAGEDLRQARLALLDAIAQTIKNGLELLGVEVLEEM